MARVALHDDLRALVQHVGTSFPGRAVRRFLRMEGIDRSLVLSSQAFTALIPLLIVVSTLAPPGGPHVVARTLITKFGLTGDSAASVDQLFAIHGVTESSLTVFSTVLLLYSGVSFTRRLQKMYRAAWDQEKVPVTGDLYAAVALIVLLAEVLIVYGIMSLVRSLPLDWLTVLPLAILTGLVPWTSVPYLLLNRQVHWRRLVVAGTLTATTMAIYSTATSLYMPGLIERYTSDFGLFGVTIAIIGWLLGAAGIVVASAATGAEFDQSRAPWARRLKERHRLVQPGLDLSGPEPAPAETGLTAADLALLARVTLTWLLMAGAVWVATYVVPELHVRGGVLSYLWLSLLLGLVNALLGPLLELFVPGVGWPRFGLAALVVNAAILAVTSWISPDLVIRGLGGTVVGALVLSLAIALCELSVRHLGPRATPPP